MGNKWSCDSYLLVLFNKSILLPGDISKHCWMILKWWRHSRQHMQILGINRLLCLKDTTRMELCKYSVCYWTRRLEKSLPVIWLCPHPKTCCFACLTHCIRETRQTVQTQIRRHRRLIMVSTVCKKLNHFSIGISKCHSLTYLKLKLESSHI